MKSTAYVIEVYYEKQTLYFKVSMKLQWLYVLKEINVNFIMFFIDDLCGQHPPVDAPKILIRTCPGQMANSTMLKCTCIHKRAALRFHTVAWIQERAV